MKRLILLFAIICIGIHTSYAVKPVTPTAEKQIQLDKQEFVDNLNLEGIVNMTPKSYEEATGQKMTFREKMGLKLAKKIAKRKQKKAVKKGDKGDQDVIGLLSMIFGILGLVLFFLGGIATLIGILLGIAGFVMGLIGLKDPNSKKLFRILGIVFGSLVILLLLLGVILIAAWL